MAGLEGFLTAYGLAAVFALLLAKSAGVPVPVPADVLLLALAARAAEGRLDPWSALAAALAALLAGSLVQFAAARGPGRGLLYRFGGYVGLTPARLDAVAGRVKRGGAVGIGLAIVTPGVRAAAVAACGLAGLPLRAFLPGLLLGDSLFLGIHFGIGYVGGPLLARLAPPVGWPAALALVGAALVLGLAGWVAIRRRQMPGASRRAVAAAVLDSWHDAVCPVCLAVGAASRLRPELGAAPISSPPLGGAPLIPSPSGGRREQDAG